MRKLELAHRLAPRSPFQPKRGVTRESRGGPCPAHMPVPCCLSFWGHFVCLWFGNALLVFTLLLMGHICLVLVILRTGRASQNRVAVSTEGPLYQSFRVDCVLLMPVNSQD